MSQTGQCDYQITVETPRETHTVTVFPNQHVQSLLGEVLAREGITQNLGQYSLVHSQDTLDPTDLVRSAGVVGGETVYLEASPSGGI